MTVSLVARRHAIAPSLLFHWRKLASSGALNTMQADEAVVPASEVQALKHHVKVRHQSAACPPESPATENNLALGRPATQSSVSRWSRLPAPEADARGANNGKIDGQFGFHTQAEPFPWWQVDLESICIVRAVRIFNRQDCAHRLRHFSILGSVDGSRWMVLHRKRDLGVFGARDLTPYDVALPKDSVARFIRIRLEGNGFLHFCECEVLGIRPDQRYAANLEARFTARLHEIDVANAARKEALIAGRLGMIVNIGENDVFVDTARYSEGIIRSLSAQTYEGKERSLVGELLQPDDRVLEVGTALGVVTMTAARIVGPEAVLAYDANPQIVADARRNFAFNELDLIQSRVGVLYNRRRIANAPAEVEFSVSRDFGASRLVVGPNGSDIIGTVRVPTVCLEEEIARHRATVLIVDIEGGEVDLLTGADLAGVRLLIMETHESAVGVEAINDMMRWLSAHGFSADVPRTGKGMAVFRR
jgi:FkbM family methyltransferase